MKPHHPVHAVDFNSMWHRIVEARQHKQKRRAQQIESLLDPEVVTILRKVLVKK
jgi:hypothetical protein